MESKPSLRTKAVGAIAIALSLLALAALTANQIMKIPLLVNVAWILVMLSLFFSSLVGYMRAKPNEHRISYIILSLFFLAVFVLVALSLVLGRTPQQ